MIEVVKKVANYYDIFHGSLVKKGRSQQKIVIAQQMAVLLITEFHTQATLNEIGKIFDRDHTTIIYRRDTMKGEIEVNHVRKKEYEELKVILYEYYAQLSPAKVFCHPTTYAAAV